MPLEVMYGSSGMLLGILSLHDLINEPRLLEGARILGRQIARRVLGRDRIRSWSRAGNGRGFAHGSAGIAGVLARAWDATVERACGEAAFQLLESLMSHDAATSGYEKISDTSWCSGAAGILRALWMSRAISESRGRLEWWIGMRERVSGRVIVAHASKDATLCCGLAGLLDVLLDATVANEYVSNAQAALSRSARGDASTLLLHLCKTKMLFGATDNDTLRPFRAGLFGGLSGIGYTLLRAAHPEALPSPFPADSMDNGRNNEDSGDDSIH